MVAEKKTPRLCRPRGSRSVAAAPTVVEPTTWLAQLITNTRWRVETLALTPCHRGFAYHWRAWAADELVCAYCSMPRLSKAENMRCDRCQKVTRWCKGMVVPMPTRYGLVVLHLGLCRECIAKESETLAEGVAL